jgi:Lrp/AsnC family leucine-responsive transcriptional regulator
MPKKAEPIDEKDRKILVELDRDARQNDSEIAKKVGLSKQVTNYRIQKLLERGIVTNFYTAVDVGSLGLKSFYIFLQLQKINKENEKLLLKRLDALDYVGWLVAGTGRWDVVLLVYADSINSFDTRLSEVINICGENLHEYTFTTLLRAEHISYKFLADRKEAKAVKQTEPSKVVSLEAPDKAILSALSQDARMPVTEIAKKCVLPAHVVNYRLKNLVKQKVIEGFKPKINVGKLGYQWHLLLIQFQQVSAERKKEFLRFCQQYKKIYYVTNTVGQYNLMLDVHVKDTEEFKDVLLDLKDRFSDIIKLYESMILFEEYKISYVPEALL